jgi:hypothetical protein
MRRVRPYIPLGVRVQVAERQIVALLYAGITIEWWDAYNMATSKATAGLKLEILLEKLSEALGGVLQLDHDPALILRQYKVDRRKPPAAWYTPNANDPDHLIYRPLREHGEKTFGRKADAEKTVTTKGSDIWLKSKFKRLEQPNKKRRAKIPAKARPWPKGRKLQGRQFRR